MWHKLNEGKWIYREKAARYFNLVIDSVEFSRWPSLLVMLLATDRSVQKKVLDKKGSTLAQRLIEAGMVLNQ